MSYPLRPGLLLVCCTVLCGQALAQTANDSTVVLPEVEVEADRTGDLPASVAGRLEVLDAEAIETTGAPSVAGLLETHTGLFIKRYGTGLATVSMRGTGSAQALILLDGLRVTDPQLGVVDLSLLPTVLLESVEVVHGPASARNGSSALGGVVRLHTLRANGPQRLKVSGSRGAYGERSLGVVASGGHGPVTGLAAAEVRRMEGDFPYRNTFLVPPQTLRREGAQRSLMTLYGRGTYRTGRHRFSAAAWYNQAERGLPGPANAEPGGAKQWDHQLRLWIESRHRYRRGTVVAKAVAQRLALRYANPRIGAHDTTHSRTVELDARADMAAGRSVLVSGGVSVAVDQADAPGAPRQLRWATFLHPVIEQGRWRVFPALRLDSYHTEGRTTAVLSPQLGINLHPIPWPGLRVKAQVGRAFRYPTFNERFSIPGGNPDLRPERGWSLEAGLHLSLPRSVNRVDTEVTVFATRLQNQIVWTPGFVDQGVQVWRPANLSRVLTRGLELSVDGHLRLSTGLKLYGGLDYTLTNARDRSDPALRSFDRQLRYVPREQFKLHTGLAWHALRLDVSGRLVGPRFITTDESMALGAYQVFDAHLLYRIELDHVATTVALFVENVFDSTYSVIRFYPMPPRHAGLRLTVNLTS